jgi:hypothetical protein
VARRVILIRVDERLGQPLPAVGLAARASRARLVDRQAGDDRGQVGLRRLERLAVLERSVKAQEPLLDKILGLAHAAEHAVGDPEGTGPQLLVKLLRRHGYFIPVAKPSRQLA